MASKRTQHPAQVPKRPLEGREVRLRFYVASVDYGNEAASDSTELSDGEKKS